ncbi:MAG: GNAT family N-acetyltransferase [Sphingomicrobium sp.]
MDCGQTLWQFYEGELGAPDVRALLDHHFAEMCADSPPEACHVLPIDGLDDPAIRLISLRDGSGRLLGVGALKALDPDHGEIKSMRTHRQALGMGVGKAILAELIKLARTAGMTRLSLETGNSALFAAANRLYEGAGFVRCGPFGGYLPTDFTHFYTREI